MIEPIAKAFSLLGEDLEFETGTIKGMPAFLMETLYNGDYKVERQDFRFQVEATSVRDYEIKPGDFFTVSDKVYLYKFKVTNDPIPDLTGLYELVSSFVSKEEI